MKNVLVITGGQAPSKDDFSSLSGEYDFVIAADSGFDTAIEYGLVVNFLVGDLDSINDSREYTLYPNTRIKKFEKDKDNTDTELALMEAKMMHASHVTLCGGNGGRADHFLSILKLFQGPLAPNVWLCQEQCIVFLSSENSNSINFFLRENETFSVYAVNDKTEPNKLLSKGALWNLETVNWNEGSYSLSNRSKNVEESISLHIQKGKFLLFLPLKTHYELK